MRFRKRTLRYYAQRNLDFCWADGRGSLDAPSFWHGTWYLQLAHLSSGSGRMRRVEDIRLVVLLCPLCHDLHQRRGGTKRIGGLVYPCLTDGNILYLKNLHDPENYDESFIREHWLGDPPEMESPDQFYRDQFRLYRRWYFPRGHQEAE